MVILHLFAVFQPSWAGSANLDVFSQVDGPNCLNGALVSAGVLPYHRYTSNQEMQMVLHSKMCQKVENSNRSKNNIGVIKDLGPYATSGIISHAFVYLTDDLSFEKRGYDKREPYHFVSTDSILSDYQVASLIGPEVEFYKCISWKDLVDAEERTYSNELVILMGEMDSLEERLYKKIKIKGIKDQILILRELINLQKKKKDASFYNDFFLLRLDSIAEQVKIFTN